ncbi:MAG: carboxypeptidase-like regulatory domain-containing protein, partial [Microbacteriaceae bacterium]|nr:carboxypeptidase-like regulatory domain-containing protein [Microbacteriaceae bacterium]
GALVRSIRIDAVIDLAKAGVRSAEDWALPVEAEARTDADGSYEFPHLPIGARTFCYSANEHGLAPQTKDLIVVQDGLGARLDVTLEKPVALRVQLDSPAAESLRLHLIPHRWWPELITADAAAGETMATFEGLGGPFRKGLVAASCVDPSTPWRIVGRFDLDASNEAKVDLSETAPSTVIEVDAAAGLEPWSKTHTEAERLFWAALSPVAMFWDVPATNQPYVPFLARTGPHASALDTGSVRGFAARAFLPVLVESRSGAAWLSWTSDASEFWASDLPAGSYRIRALDIFGKPTFARGAYIRPGTLSSLESSTSTQIDRDEPANREAMGFVRWENGAPGAKAVVYMQNLRDFRRYVRRAEANEQGYFRFASVLANEPYLMFAIPAQQKAAMKNLTSTFVEPRNREVWTELVLHPHKVTGRLEGSGSSPLQLVQLTDGGERVAWTFSTDKEGRFSVENVPHGRYRVQALPCLGASAISSWSFEVTEHSSETVVGWPSS